MKDIVGNLEKKTEEMIYNDPQNHQNLLKWKNYKMHQLMAAQSILSS